MAIKLYNHEMYLFVSGDGDGCGGGGGKAVM